VGKKLTKLAQITYKNKENVGVVKKKEEERHMMKIADTCAKIVHREFWRNIHKMLRFNDQKLFNEEKKKFQQEKLESLVSKQLQLSSKMADFLNNSSKKMSENKEMKDNLSIELKNEEILKDDIEETENLDESLLNNERKSLVISLNKEENNKYSFDAILSKEIDINGNLKAFFFYLLSIEQKHSLEEIRFLAETFKPLGFTLHSNDTAISQPFLLKNELRYIFIHL